MPATPAAFQTDEIARLEQAVADAKTALTTALRARPPEGVRDYTLRLAGSGASVQLSELFGTSRDLIVVHNMGRS
ncbi:MAG: hypothetical protein ACK58T_23930, partial [Phycisphaerae bacterium]